MISNVFIMWSSELTEMCSSKDLDRISDKLTARIREFLSFDPVSVDVPLFLNTVRNEFPVPIVASHIVDAGENMYVFLDSCDVELHRLCYQSTYPKIH